MRQIALRGLEALARELNLNWTAQSMLIKRRFSQRPGYTAEMYNLGMVIKRHGHQQKAVRGCGTVYQTAAQDLRMKENFLGLRAQEYFDLFVLSRQI